MAKCAWAALRASRTNAFSRPSGTRRCSGSHSIYAIKRQAYESGDHSTVADMNRGRPPRPGASDSGTVDRYDEPGLRPAPFDQLGWSVVCSTFGRFTARLGLYARWAAIQDAG